MLGAPRRMSPYFSLRNGDAPPGRVGWQDVDNKMITITMPPPRVSRPGQRGPGDGDGWAVYRRGVGVSALRRWGSCPGGVGGAGGRVLLAAGSPGAVRVRGAVRGRRASVA